MRRKYGRKPILTDRAGWYDAACRWLRLPHRNYLVDEKTLWPGGQFSTVAIVASKAPGASPAA